MGNIKDNWLLGERMMEIGIPVQGKWEKVAEGSDPYTVPDIPLEPGKVYRVRARFKYLREPSPELALYKAIQEFKARYPYIYINYVKIYKENDQYIAEIQVFDDPGITAKIIAITFLLVLLGVITYFVIDKIVELAEVTGPPEETRKWVWIAIGVALIGYGVGKLIGAMRKKK